MWNDLTEHIGAIIAILGILASLVGLFAGLAGFFFWRLISGISKKADNIGTALIELIGTCGGRELGCLKQFVTKKEFEDWRQGRTGPGGLWDAINHHSHDKEGKVIRQ